MHPYIGQALAAERVRDWHRQAALVRRAKQARRARRGPAKISAEHLVGLGPAAWQIEQLPQARIPELGGAGRDHRHPVGAGRA